MQIFGLTIAWTKDLALRTKQSTLTSSYYSGGGWFPIWPIIRESFTGAWQSNQELSRESVLTYSAVYACVTLIASDIAKMRLRLVQQDANGIWEEVTTNVPWAPVLRKPNPYQTRIKFVEWWLVSKLIHGNTYVLKRRDARGIVNALYILDPTRVRVLIAPDGSVFYALMADNLSNIQASVTIPAREIIHDIMVPFYHPLSGVSSLTACGLAALQGLKIQQNSTAFFSNGSQPGGVLSAPGTIPQETADRLKTYWETQFTGDNTGKIAVLGDGLKYEQMGVNAHDAQLIEQLKWTSETVCSTFHVPPYMIGVGPPPNYNNIEALNQQYYSQCLQTLIESLELALDEGLELPKPYGTEFDLDDLIRMDTAGKVDAAQKSIGSGGMSPNEARFKYFDLGPTPGGETPYMQEQNWPLRLLADRELPTTAPTEPKPMPGDDESMDDDDMMDDETASIAEWRLKSVGLGLPSA